jgi:hypothetical protein
MPEMIYRAEDRQQFLAGSPRESGTSATFAAIDLVVFAVSSTLARLRFCRVRSLSNLGQLLHQTGRGQEVDGHRLFLSTTWLDNKRGVGRGPA